MKEAFYAQLQMVMESCPKGDNLIVLRDFNATTGTDRDGYQSCVGPYDSGSTDETSSVLIEFPKSRHLESLDFDSRGRTCTAGLGNPLAVAQGRRSTMHS